MASKLTPFDSRRLLDDRIAANAKSRPLPICKLLNKLLVIRTYERKNAKKANFLTLLPVVLLNIPASPPLPPACPFKFRLIRECVL